MSFYTKNIFKLENLFHEICIILILKKINFVKMIINIFYL